MNILTIGGSDPSSGAGIQSDIKDFQILGAYALTSITAITGQNTSRFGQVQSSSKKIMKNQLEMIFSDFKVDGIKIGMVYNSDNIKTVYNYLKKLSIPIVLDPVIKSTTGGMLIQTTAISDFKKYLIPLATVITPNISEAEILSKSKINSKRSLIRSGREIQRLGAKNIVITGTPFGKNTIVDFVMTETNQEFIESKRLESENHGSGGNYSAALIYSLVKGKSILESAKFAQKFSFDSIKGAQKRGKGIPITNKKVNREKIQLDQAIEQFTKIKNIAKNIPECQTNFVFSKKCPKSTNDILGISGRIVKAGNVVVKAGELEYGGSKHVATAVFTINKKFKNIRSAVNLKFSNETIEKLEKNGFTVKVYNRQKEPKKIKNREGASIQWGINTALSNIKNPPDAIYHKGDFGKEPMILIFGEDPKEVNRKVMKINS